MTNRRWGRNWVVALNESCPAPELGPRTEGYSRLEDPSNLGEGSYSPRRGFSRQKRAYSLPDAMLLLNRPGLDVEE